MWPWIVLLVAAFAGDLRREAAALMEAGRFAQAAAKYEQIVGADPKAAEAWFALGVCYSQTSRPEEAVAALRRHLNLSPDSADGHAVLGLVHISRGRIAEARAELLESLRLDPRQPEAIKAMARLESAGGDPARAIELLDRLRHTPDFDEEGRLAMATALAKAGRHREAIALLQPVLAAPRPPLEAFLIAGRAGIAAGEDEAAAGLCERGLSLYPNSDRLEGIYFSVSKPIAAARINARLGALLSGGGSVAEMIALGRVLTRAEATRSTDFRGAEGLLARAVKLAPADPTARYNYGRCLHNLGKHEQAIPVLEQALALTRDPELTAIISSQLGEALAQASRREAAERAFLTTVSVNRTLPVPASEAAFAYVRFLSGEGRAGDALRVTEEILLREPFFLPARLERGRHFMEQERWREAVEDGEFVARNASGDAQLERAAHVLLARSYFALGNQQLARKHQDLVRAK